jgi:hypothetical protein
MANHTENNYKTSMTLWQENEDGCAEHAIVFERCHGGINLQQHNDSVYICDEAIADFIKTLKSVSALTP